MNKTGGSKGLASRWPGILLSYADWMVIYKKITHELKIYKVKTSI
jgi:hypothetical protein